MVTETPSKIKLIQEELDVKIKEAADSFKAILSKAMLKDLDFLSTGEIDIKKTHQKIIIEKELAVITMVIDGEEMAWRGVSFKYERDLHESSSGRSYVGFDIDYMSSIDHWSSLLVTDKIHDVNNGSHQYNMSQFEITRSIFRALHKFSLTIQNF